MGGIDFNNVILGLELAGVVSFTLSGIMTAKAKHMDLFGTVVLGGVTAVGGGVIRDLILGNTPPSVFIQPIYVTLSFFVSLAGFALLYYHKLDTTHPRYNHWMNLADNFGLAVFVISGVKAAADAGYADNAFLTLFVAALTGTGGGILRDIFAGEIPLVLRKRIYAIAAIAGASVYYVLQLRLGMPVIPSSLISIFCTVLLRYLASRYRWDLPVLPD